MPESEGLWPKKNDNAVPPIFDMGTEEIEVSWDIPTFSVLYAIAAAIQEDSDPDASTSDGEFGQRKFSVTECAPSHDDHSSKWSFHLEPRTTKAGKKLLSIYLRYLKSERGRPKAAKFSIYLKEQKSQEFYFATELGLETFHIGEAGPMKYGTLGCVGFTSLEELRRKGYLSRANDKLELKARVVLYGERRRRMDTAKEKDDVNVDNQAKTKHLNVNTSSASSNNVNANANTQKRKKEEDVGIDDEEKSPTATPVKVKKEEQREPEASGSGSLGSSVSGSLGSEKKMDVDVDGNGNTPPLGFGLVEASLLDDLVRLITRDGEDFIFKVKKVQDHDASAGAAAGSDTVLFQAHKYILMARSPFFARMVDADSTVSELQVEGISAQNFGILLKYIYEDVLELGTEEEMNSARGWDRHMELLKFSQEWELNILKNHLETLFEGTLTPQNAMERFLMAKRMNLEVSKIRKYILETIGP